MAAGKQRLHACESNSTACAGHDNGLRLIDIHSNIAAAGEGERRLRLHLRHGIFDRLKAIRNAGN